MTSNWLKWGKRLGYPFSAIARRVKRMKKQFLSWLFVLGMGYIFVELQRLLTGVKLSSPEWVGFIVIAGGTIWLWKQGEHMDKAERKERVKENENREQKLIEAFKEALKDDREQQHKDNIKKSGD